MSQTNGTLIDALSTLVRENQALNTAIHTVDTKRNTLRSAVHREIEDLHSNVKDGVARLEHRVLTHDGARYLHIDLGSYRAPLTMVAHCVRHVRAIPLVYREADDTIVAHALRENDTSALAGTPHNDAKPWRCHPSFAYNPVYLPLNGPALNHGAYRRMATYAANAAAGRNPTICAMQAADAERLVHTQRAATLRAEADALVSTMVDPVQLAAQHASLVERMQRFDWWWDYADRPNYRYGDVEQELLSDLLALPEADAIALWQLYSPDPMGDRAWQRVINRKDLTRHHKAA